MPPSGRKYSCLVSRPVLRFALVLGLQFLFVGQATAGAQAWTYDCNWTGWTLVNGTPTQLQSCGTCGSIPHIPCNPGSIRAHSSNTDMQLISPTTPWPNAGDFKGSNSSDHRNYLRMGYRNWSSDGGGRIYADYGSGFTSGNSIAITTGANSTGSWRYKTVNMSAIPNWPANGSVKRIRIDPFDITGADFDVDFIVIRVDDRVPTMTSMTASPATSAGSWTNQSTFTIQVSASDPAPQYESDVQLGVNPDKYASGVDYFQRQPDWGSLTDLDTDADWIEGTASETFTLAVPKGQHRLSARPVDVVGFAPGDWSYVDMFSDPDRPAAPPGLYASPGGWTRANSFSFCWGAVTTDFNGTPNYSGVSRYEYQVDGGGVVPVGALCTSSIAASSVGIHTFSVRAVDGAGNPGDWSSVPFYYDPVVPGISFSQPAPANYRTDQGISFSISDAHSGVSGFCAQWDNPTPPGSACVGQSSGSTAISSAGGYYSWHTLYVHAYDRAGNVTTASSGPWMLSPNRAPLAYCPGAQGVNEASQLAFSVTGSDPDGDPVTISPSSMPAGASFDGATFRWTPSYSQAGDYQPCFTASDPWVTGSGCCVAIHVANLDRPPVISCPGSQTTSEGVLLTITVTASDPDGDSITFTGQNLPQGATFEGGVFRWIPSRSQSGDYLPRFTASSNQLSASCDVPVHVDDVPAPVVRVVYPNGSETLMAGATETLRWTATGSAGVTGVDLYLSRNGPAGTFTSLATGIPNSGAHPWMVTGPASSDCYLKVVAHDGNGNTGEDRSDMAFAIAAVRDEMIWCAEQRITHDTPHSEAPDLAVTPSGVHVVWQEGPESAASWDVDYSRGTRQWPADTMAWQPATALSGSPSSHSPSIAVDLQGRLHVAWAHNEEPATGQIFYRRCDGSWGAPECLRTGQNTAQDPSIVVDGADDVHVIWSEFGAGQGTIYQKRWNSAWEPDEIVSQGASRLHPDLAADSQNRLHAVWLGGEGGALGVYYKAWEYAWGSEVQVNALSADATSPAVAVDVLGRVHVVWSDTRSGHPEVYYRSGDGTTWDPEFVVSPLDEGSSVTPDVSVDGAGRVHVVWCDTCDGNAEIYHRIWDGAWLPAERVTDAAGISSTPRIVCTGDYIYLAWSDDRDGNPEIYWRKGTVCPNGDCQELPTPALASLADWRIEGGRVLLRWYVSGSDLGSTAVYRQTPGTDWTRLGERSPDGAGYLAFEDVGVTAGSRYGYRLGLRTAQGEVSAGETWVEVPALSFALQGVRPNPAEGGVLSVHFTLPSAVPASLALYDVSGRQVQKLDVGALGAGVHMVELRPQATLAAGVYLLRLAQGPRVMTQRVAVVK